MENQARTPVLKEALRRLCRRCPALLEKDFVKSLLENEALIAAPDIIDLVKSLLLEQEYTIPTVSLFRPVLLSSVASLVEEELECLTEGGSSKAALLACILPKLLVLAPHLEREVLRYFEKNPSPIFYLKADAKNLRGNIDKAELAQSSLWGLLHSLELRSLWKWTDFISFALDEDPYVSWCCRKSLGILLCNGDITNDFLGQSMDLSNSQLASIKWHSETAALTLGRLDMWHRPPNLSCESFIPKSGYVDLCGCPVPRKGTSLASSLLITPNVKEIIQGIAMGLSIHEPILIEGPPSSGKSAIISHISATTGNANDLINIHLDDQTDSKSLLGAYVCTSRPGHFVWQPGPLTQAVARGCWAIIEDINLAPPDVLAILLPLVERGTLHIPSRGEEIRAARGFQLIATVTTHPGGSGSGVYHNAHSVKDTLSGYFYVVKTKNLSLEDQKEIIYHRYPALKALIPHAMNSILTMQVAMRQYNKNELNGQILRFVKDVLSQTGFQPGEWSLGRYFGLRDALKWSKRMNKIHDQLLKRSLRISPEEYWDLPSSLPVAVREFAYLEMVDCLLAGISNHAVVSKLFKALGMIWAIPDEFIEYSKALAKPEISTEGSRLSIGRVSMPLFSVDSNTAGVITIQRRNFAQTGHSMRALERIAVAVDCCEPVLLVGETGTGKTTIVQELANLVQSKLVVINVSQQTDSSDLIGGFKPLQPSEGLRSILPEFINLVRRTWTRGNNEEFISRVVKLAQRQRWEHLRKAFQAAVAKARASSSSKNFKIKEQEHPAKKMRRHSVEIPADVLEDWEKFASDLKSAERLTRAAEGGFAFGFVEGALVQAVRNGWWLLLDEINLAPAEVLERIASLLDQEGAGITVAERGDVKALHRHQGFRIFGAMNPATDAGKRDLPAQIRNRFTEFWLSEPQLREDLSTIVAGYLLPVSLTAPIDSIVELYLAAKGAAEDVLQDGAGNKPAYNLRTLTRALEYSTQAVHVYGMQRALYDGFAMSFLTQLEPVSASHMERMLQQHLFSKDVSLSSIMGTPPKRPSDENVILFDHYWVKLGNGPVAESKESDGRGGTFVATSTVLRHLRNLARAVLLYKYPILLQGPTSSGKTSLLSYLAAQTGHHFIRINNHEHTDLQEYLGAYVSDDQGRLVFQEGPLVQAIRNGYWIVLDELNLAPTDVLEALNRLLDDNRELFVPELQEVIKPHPQFMLFATQNPPGQYAGRKILSKAFRSRFLELHIEDIPDNELHIILEKRCKIAPSYSVKLVAAMRELQRRRSISNAFAGRHGFITPRDLFRWAGRGAVGYQQLAEDGFALLGERLRNAEERRIVCDVMEKVMKAKIDMESLYKQVETSLDMVDNDLIESVTGPIVWTVGFSRMLWLLRECLKHSEPALLVGETGLGKTSACQIAALSRNQKLRIINCNQHTETSDFLGGYRPNRGREFQLNRLKETIETCILNLQQLVSVDSIPAWPKRITIADISDLIESLRKKIQELEKETSAEFANYLNQVDFFFATYRAPFVWVDGPLVQAMKNGDILLIDEINLAEDAVIERLNSVLETHGTLTLAEKGGVTTETIVPHPEFRIVATMNPSGDFGKKELSPALANRFSTIWIPSLEDESEMTKILEVRIKDPEMKGVISRLMIDFLKFFRKEIASRCRYSLSIRDLLAWVNFVNLLGSSLGSQLAYLHGAHLTFIDGLGLGVGLSDSFTRKYRTDCQNFLLSQLSSCYIMQFEVDLNEKVYKQGIQQMWGFEPFFIESHKILDVEEFSFKAPTTAKNCFRILRALQMRKPILLEGSPGVGKTSLIAAMAKRIGRSFIRINLSEQTEIMDLLGADLPTENGEAGQFSWCDGPLLTAIKTGAWVLLDELNLANQTILEGLNSLLDHRKEVFVPELNETFQSATGFRIFGAQNPIQEGGGRKGLPRSFLNRFSRVHIELLCRDDLQFILSALYPDFDITFLKRMIDVTLTLHYDANERQAFGKDGGPWEFNLRDLLRWCNLLAPHAQSLSDSLAAYYGDMLFTIRMRSFNDRQHVQDVIRHYFDDNDPMLNNRSWEVGQDFVRVGLSSLHRTANASNLSTKNLILRNESVAYFEAAMKCIDLQWMCLLVGPSGVGKTTMIRCLASLCGQELVEIPLNSATDASDLLGGFEQSDTVRSLRSIRDQLLKSLAKFLIAKNRDLLPSGSLAICERMANKISCMDPTVQTYEEVCKQLTEVFQSIREMANSSEISEMGDFESKIIEIEKSASKLLKEGPENASFQWVDGTLTRAIIEGRWVILDHANLCNPSVLDRLNALLEPNGVLYLNECGTDANGRPRILRPHPDFRLFLILDPKNGDVSRAMRNRGIEIYLLPEMKSGLSTIATRTLLSQEDICLDVTDKVSNISIVDVETLVGSTYSLNHQLSSLFVAIHMQIRLRAVERHCKPPGIRDIKRWIQVAEAMVSCGANTYNSIKVSFSSIYSNWVDLLYDIEKELDGAHSINPAVTWLQPGIWPFPATIQSMVLDSRTTRFLRDVGPVFYWIGMFFLSARCSGLEGSNSLADTGSLQNILEKESYGACVMLPGTILTDASSQRLESNQGDLQLDFERKSDSAMTSQYNLAMVFQAIRIFMELCSPQDAFPMSLLLQQCRAVGMALGVQTDSSILVDIDSIIDTWCEHSLYRMVASRGDVSRHSLDCWTFEDPFVVAVRDAIVEEYKESKIFQNTKELREGSPGSYTLLELSILRSKNPQSRLRLPTPHSAVDWIWPIFLSLRLFEQEALSFENTSMDDGNSKPSDIMTRGPSSSLVLSLQDHRWKFFHACHIHALARASEFSQHSHNFAHAWIKLKDAIENFAPSICSCSEKVQKAFQKLVETGNQMNAVLNLDFGPEQISHLWKKGGKPSLPGSLRDLNAVNSARNICNELSLKGEDPKPIHDLVLPLVFEAVGRTKIDDQEWDEESEETKNWIEAVSAAIIADVELRQSLFEGACLIQATAYTPNTRRSCEESAEEMLQSLLKAIKTRASEFSDRFACSRLGEDNYERLKDERKAISGVLPPLLMSSGLSRDLQRELARLSDIRISRSFFRLLADRHTRILSLLYLPTSWDGTQLESIRKYVSTLTDHSLCDVYQGTPYMLIKWLHNSDNVQTIENEWREELIANAAHEAWYSWHCQLWELPSASEEGNFGCSSSPDHGCGFARGPGKLHTSTISDCISSLLEFGDIPIEHRESKQIQLELATQQLLQLCSEKDDYNEIVQLEWKASVYIFVSTVKPYLSQSFSTNAFDERNIELEQKIESMLGSMVKADDPEGIGARSNEFHHVFSLWFQSHAHPILKNVGNCAILPALESICDASAVRTDEEGLNTRARIWSFLGLARFHLLIPVSGTDPAMELDFQRQDAVLELEWIVKPKLEMRYQYSMLPGMGSKQILPIKEAQKKKTELETLASSLKDRSTPRPVVSQYMSLREEVSRFSKGMASLNGIIKLFDRMGTCDPHSFVEAKAWQQASEAGMMQISYRYPLYRDIVQPLHLAIKEIQYGLELFHVANNFASHVNGTDAQELARIVYRFISFPNFWLVHEMNNDLFDSDCDIKTITQDIKIVGSLASHSARQNSSNDMKQDRDQIARQAELEAQIEVLTIELRNGKQNWNSSSSIKERINVSKRMARIFEVFVKIWEDIKEEEDRRAGEEAELFKTKVQNSHIKTEEEIEEEDFQEKYPDTFSAFADLDMELDETIQSTKKAGERPELDRESLEGERIAAYAARRKLMGPVLREIVKTQILLFGDLEGLKSCRSSVLSRSFDDFINSYNVGMKLMRQASVALPCWIDDEAISGHIYALSLFSRKLNLAKFDSTNESKEMSDIYSFHESHLREASLMQRPIQLLRKKLNDLLVDWPNHPVLVQLLAISDRLLKFPVSSPLKTLLTGLELLLSKAQLWEETAAKHVSLGEFLKDIGALGTRWRRLELESWKGLLSRTISQVAESSFKSWFHMYRLIFKSEVTVQEIAAAVGDFLQLSPLGEYATRISIISGFHGQLMMLESKTHRENSIESVLYNICRYYNQFVLEIESHIKSRLSEHEKELKNFVKLAKWEDRGFYARKASTEKAQRHLHRLSRRATEVLKEPVTEVLKQLAANMGISELFDPESLPKKSISATDPTMGSGKAVIEILSNNTFWVQKFNSTKNNKKLVEELLQEFGPHLHLKYALRLPELTERFLALIKSRFESNYSLAAIHADGLAAQAADRAFQLRSDTSKGSKARKKKALVDLYHVLEDSGISKLRSAVPGDKRGVQAWFAEPRACVQSILHVGSEFAASEQLRVAESAWNKADAYFFASLARIQRLIEASTHPSTDLMMHEVQYACNFAEHLLYLTQLGRKCLTDFACEFAKLEKLSAFVFYISSGGDIVLEQDKLNLEIRSEKKNLKILILLLKESREVLLTAPAQEGEDQQTSGSKAADILQDICLCLENLNFKLQKSLDETVRLPSDNWIVTSKVKDILEEIRCTVSRFSSQLSVHEYVRQPCWHQICSAFAQACSHRPGEKPLEYNVSAGEVLSDLMHRVDLCIESALIWAQNLISSREQKGSVGAGGKKEDLVGNPKLSSEVSEIAASLGVSRLRNFIEAQMSVADKLFTLGNVGDELTIKKAMKLYGGIAKLMHILSSAAWQAAANCLALHRSLSKLTYVGSCILSDVVAEGFCVPELAEEEGGMEDSKMVEGTGLGEADTRGAKDISNELEDQDQILGAEQKNANKEDHENDRPEPEGEGEAKGIEMDDDFNGTLEDLGQGPEEEEEDEGKEDDSDGERLDQQMGDVGDTGEEVDEKLWNPDGEENDPNDPNKRESGYDKDNEIKAEDQSKLDYAQGTEDIEDREENENEKEEAPIPTEEKSKLQGDVEEEEEEEDLGDYQDRPEDRGFVKPEAPELEMDLPEDLNLDGEEQEREGEQDEKNEEAETETERFDDLQMGNEDEKKDEKDDAAEKKANSEDRGEEEIGNDSGLEDYHNEVEDEFAGEEEKKEEAGEDADNEEEDRQMIEPEHRIDDRDGMPKTEDDSMAVQNFGFQGQHLESSTAQDDETLQSKENRDIEEQKTNPIASSTSQPQQNATENSAPGPTSGLHDDSGATQTMDLETSNASPKAKSQREITEANPFRSLGSAVQKWQNRLQMIADASREGHEDQQDRKEVEELMEENPHEHVTGSFRYLEENESGQHADLQTLAAATEEQALIEPEDTGADVKEGEKSEGDVCLGDNEDETIEDMDVDKDYDVEDQTEIVTGKSLWGTGATERSNLEQNVREERKEQEENKNLESVDDFEEGSIGADQKVDQDMNQDSIVATHRTDFADIETLDICEKENVEVDSNRIEFLRRELDQRLRLISEGSILETDLDHGQAVWARCETLTSGLVGELTEQLRLILEPSMATKLGGEYRTGKRINMKRVIGYIASHFRKDKIWMRRTKPDKRQYQVLVAVDDSRSMAETGCNTFAVEAVTLICRSMARLEVGELGVVSFGGSGGAQPLHPLEKPFSDADGVRIMGKLRFDADNTINDQPIADVITSIDHLLELASARASSSFGAPSSLHQLVLIIADGRFHEKEALRKAARDAASRPGVLYAFIILDNPENSILDMQSVSFVNGKPVFTKYIDTFPFPFYIVLRDMASLPQTLADLLRQWFERSSSE